MLKQLKLKIYQSIPIPSIVQTFAGYHILFTLGINTFF